MNLAHRWICSSARWRKAVERDGLPWTLEGVELGSSVLEVGPGYGAVTDVLRRRVAHLTCVEIDAKMAEALRKRTRNQNVTVICGDATKMPLADASFDSAVCFTMLHHVPSPKLQDELLAEVARTLRPGGVITGTDNWDSGLFRFKLFRLIHLFDTLTVINPAIFAERLRMAGFEDVEVHTRPTTFRFRARKPSLEDVL